MDVRLEISQAFIIQLEWTDDGSKRLPYREHLVEELMRLTTRHQVDFADMAFSEQHAIPPIELGITENQP